MRTWQEMEASMDRIKTSAHYAITTAGLSPRQQASAYSRMVQALEPLTTAVHARRYGWDPLNLTQEVQFHSFR